MSQFVDGGGVGLGVGGSYGNGPSNNGGGWLGAALAALPAVTQGIQGLSQRNKARKLNQSDFDYVPQSFQENKALAAQQAYSRRSPGAALAEENIRRNLATTIGGAKKMYGGDANKMAQVISGANVKANDSARQIAAQGQQFSENAFGRLQNANSQIGGQQRQNYNDFWKTKSALLYASDQNIFNAINNGASAGLGYLSGKKGGYGGMNPYYGPGYGGYGGYGGGGWAPWMSQGNQYGQSGMVASGYSN